MLISKSLLKYGYSNFKLEILEFCSVEEVSTREKYYIELLNPEYNISKIPRDGKRLGFNHTEEAKIKLKLYHSNRPKEVLVKMSKAQLTSQKVEVLDLVLNKKTLYDAIKSAAQASLCDIDHRLIKNYIYLNQTKPVKDRYQFKLIGEPKIKMSNVQVNSKKLEVTDLLNNGVKTIYPSVSSAAKAIGEHQASISLYLKENRQKPFKGKYYLKLI